MKKIFNFIVIILLFTIFISSTNNNVEVKAFQKSDIIGEVELGGDTIGLKIDTKVEIVGKYEVKTKNGDFKPWENSDIIDGDYIYSINSMIINNNDDLNKIVKNSKENTLNLVLIRENQLIETKINIVKNKNNVNSIGLYVKDHITGIGTLTFVNTKTNKYASLGHNVNDALSNGKLYESSIKGIKKAIKGVPGEKYATISEIEIGNIEENNSIGVFGTYYKNDYNNIVNIIKRDAVELGDAQIVTVINGNIKNTYDIEIVEVEKQEKEDVKGIKFKITDEELLNSTGGVIQGMSGSPIIQNGNLIGAVSHVVVNEPIYGFGVFAEWMFYRTL